MLRYIWSVTVQMAPYVLFGFLMAGLLRLVLSADTVQKYMGRSRFAVLWAALLGVPLPLCSCGVLPVAAALRKAGARKGAVAAFLLSTPQTGVDNILATYGLMGLGFAVWRPIQAFIMGILGGTVIDLTDTEKNAPETDGGCHCHKEENTGDSCCCRSEAKADGGCHCHKEENTGDSCCHSEAKADGGCHCHKEENTDGSCCCEAADGCGRECFVVSALRFAFWELPRDIGGHLLLGLILAGIFGCYVRAEMLYGFGGLWGQIFAAVLLGLPMYVCSTASIPIAFGLVSAGFEPGAALAFMVTGPETNLAAMAVVHKLLGTRGLVLYMLTVIITACTCGALLNNWLTVPAAVSAGQAHPASAVWGVILTAVLACGFLRKILNR